MNWLIQMRHFRILGMASSEILSTLFLVAIFTYFFDKKRSNKLVTFLSILLCVMYLAIMTHIYFGVNTQLNWWLGYCRCPPDYNSLTGIFNCSA